MLITGDTAKGIPPVPFGSVIELEIPPTAINVEIKAAHDGSTKVSTRRKMQLKILQQSSILPDMIVIPLIKGQD